MTCRNDTDTTSYWMTGRGSQSVFFFVFERHTVHGNIMLRKIAGEYSEATSLRGTFVYMCSVLGMRRQPCSEHSCTSAVLRQFACRRRLFLRSCPRSVNAYMHVSIACVIEFGLRALVVHKD